MRKNLKARPKVSLAAELLLDAGNYTEAAARQVAAAAGKADDLGVNERFELMQRQYPKALDATTREFLRLTEQVIEVTRQIRLLEAVLREGLEDDDEI